MHSRLFLAICMIPSSLFSPLAVAADSYRGIPLPAQLGGLERGTIIDNEVRSRGLGITVAYGSSGVKATVFIYNLGIQDLIEGIESPTVKAHAQQTLKDIIESHTDVSVLEPLSPGIGSCAGFLRAKLSYVEKGGSTAEPLHSYVYLSSRKGSFVKARVSYAARIAFATGTLSESRFAEALCATVLK